MSGDRSRLLKVGEYVYWEGRKADRGKVVENDWSAVKILWDKWAHEFDLPQRHDQRGIGAREILSMVVSGLTWNLLPRNRARSFMAIPTIEKREEYVSYAEHCVKLARQTNDPESRGILREMAAEWLRLVDAADH